MWHAVSDLSVLTLKSWYHEAFQFSEVSANRCNRNICRTFCKLGSLIKSNFDRFLYKCQTSALRTAELAVKGVRKAILPGNSGHPWQQAILWIRGPERPKSEKAGDEGLVRSSCGRLFLALGPLIQGKQAVEISLKGSPAVWISFPYEASNVHIFTSFSQHKNSHIWQSCDSLKITQSPSKTNAHSLDSDLHNQCVINTMLSSKIYMFWRRKCGDSLINNQNIAICLQIDHPGSRQWVCPPWGVQCMIWLISSQ